jgi:4-hydroxy-tetrahydrodipicolinate synthase
MSRCSRIKGIIPPIITPMNEDESFNEAEFRRQIDRQLAGGVHGIFCYGTNGECYALTMEEKETILKAAVEQVGGRVPVYAGTGCITTKETVEMSKRAEALGADVLSVITPYFAAVSQEELYEHYVAVAEAVSIPIVLYNIPARTGCAIAPETVERLAEIDNIVGAKDSSGNWDNLKAYIEMTKNKDFAVLSGNDSLILKALQAGGVGGIAGCANVYPHNMVAIYERFKAGDIEGAQKAQDDIASFRECFKYGNPNTIVKTAVGLLGYPVGGCRKPFYSVSAQGIEVLKEVLEENKKNGMS